MSQKRITGLDSRIFANLIRAKRSLSVKQIAMHAGISWLTANIHVQKMAKLNILFIKKTVRKNRVQINPKFITYLKLNDFLNQY